MASILRSALRTSQIQPIHLARPTPIQSRTFTSALRLRLKEDKEQHPEEVERVKQEQLAKQKKSEGHWHEELASASESNVKADREKVNDHDEHIKDLQKETAGKHEKEHPDGKASH